MSDHHILSIQEMEELVKKKGISYVINRRNEHINLDLVRIKERLEKLAFGLSSYVNIDLII